MNSMLRPFNPSSGASSPTGPWKISEEGAQGMAFWRRDGRELTFLGPDRSILSVAMTTTGDFEFGKPTPCSGCLKRLRLRPAWPA
jgi:hypothetical protein